MKKKLFLFTLLILLIFTLVSCGDYSDIKGSFVGVSALDTSGEFRDASSTSLEINKDGTFKFTLSESYILTGNLEYDSESNDVEKSYKLTNLNDTSTSGYVYICYSDNEWTNPYLILITEENQYIFSFEKK